MLRKPVMQVPSEVQAREKLAVYVYEYLHHLGAHNAAQAFLAEIGWDRNIDIGESPGFLTSWWSVFWDLYCAAPERRDHGESSNEAKAFHDYGYANSCGHSLSAPPHGFQGLRGAPVMLMPGGEMVGPGGHMEFYGPVGHMGHMAPHGAHPGMQLNMVPGGLAFAHGGRGGGPGGPLPMYSGCGPNGVRFVGPGGPMFNPQAPCAYGPQPTCCGTSPQGPLGGPPSVASVQSNPSAFSSGQPQTVANGNPSRPSPWRTPNGASSYCTSPYAASSLPESIGAPPAGSQLGSIVAQADGLGSMLLGESDGFLGSDLSHMFNGASSPHGDDVLVQPGSFASGFDSGSSCGLTTQSRRDACENTAAAILKIKESMREEAKRFETSDSSSVITQNSN